MNRLQNGNADRKYYKIVKISVFILLFGTFCYEGQLAFGKLLDYRIGTLVGYETTSDVVYPSIHICDVKITNYEIMNYDNFTSEMLADIRGFEKDLNEMWVEPKDRFLDVKHLKIGQYVRFSNLFRHDLTFEFRFTRSLQDPEKAKAQGYDYESLWNTFLYLVDRNVVLCNVYEPPKSSKVGTHHLVRYN